MILSSNPIRRAKQVLRERLQRLEQSLKSTAAWAVVEPYWLRIRNFFGRPLVQHYIQLATRRTTWALLAFLAWRLVPIVYESAVFAFELDLFALQAANMGTNEDYIRQGVVLEALDRGLLVDPDDVRVQIDQAKRIVVLDVTYHGPVDLFVKQFTLNFHTHSRRYAVTIPMDMR